MNLVELSEEGRVAIVLEVTGLNVRNGVKNHHDEITCKNTSARFDFYTTV